MTLDELIAALTRLREAHPEFGAEKVHDFDVQCGWIELDAREVDLEVYRG